MADQAVACEGSSCGDKQFAEQQALSKAIRESVAYRQLSARFRSLFTWPALLSELPVRLKHMGSVEAMHAGSVQRDSFSSGQ